MLNIIADENIPDLDEYFAAIGQINRLPGRSISAADVKNADILLVRSVTQVNQALLEHSTVKFVGTATIGTNHIDTHYLTEQNIGWANAPGSNADSVVDYVISALCELPELWSRLLAKQNPARVGIIGMGNIGSRLYRRLTSAGIQCIGYDPLLSRLIKTPITSEIKTPISSPISSLISSEIKTPINLWLVEFEDILNCDVICCHVPLTKTGEFPSFHLMGVHELVALKKGAVLISAGRGEVVDNQALLALMRQGKDLNLVMDVWESEPDISIALLDYCQLATPHIAGYSYQGKRRGTYALYQTCCRYFNKPCELDFSAAVERPLNFQLDKSLIESVRKTVLQAYSVKADSDRFKNGIKAMPNTIGQLFDQQRKNYPIRNEFSCFYISNKDYANSAKPMLEALGFNF